MKFYEMHLPTQRSNSFKITQMQRTIKLIQNADHPIRSRDDAQRAGVKGAKTLAKVDEILRTGGLSLVQESSNSSSFQAMLSFLNIHGVGPSTAGVFVARGWLSLEDLRRNRDKLNRVQRIGLDLYADLTTKIPRAEVAEIFAVVKECACRIDPGLVLEVCGSYRRGKPACGDIDILISHPNGHGHEGVLPLLVQALTASGFMTHALTTPEESDMGHGKFMGTCRLSDRADALHRRLDLIVTPWVEWGPALLYFTGSAHFNRSMRLLASEYTHIVGVPAV